MVVQIVRAMFLTLREEHELMRVLVLWVVMPCSVVSTNHNAEDHGLNIQCRENLKSRNTD